MAAAPSDPLAGRAGYWHRQMADTAEKTWQDVLVTVTDIGGGNLLVPKVADGLRWQGRIDPETPMNSLGDLQDLITLGQAHGVLVSPVVVPRGQNILAEANFHAAIARTAGSLHVDLEAGPGMWDGADLDQIPSYWQALRDRAPGAWLINQPDPRPFGLKDARVVESADFYDAVSGQHYVGWVDPALGVHWTDVAGEVLAFQGLAALGKSMHVTLWGEGDPSYPNRFWEYVKGSAVSCHMFRLGTMDTAHLQAFAGFSRPRQPAPPQAPFDLAARLQLIGFAAGGSGVVDLTRWLGGYVDAP